MPCVRAILVLVLCFSQVLSIQAGERTFLPLAPIRINIPEFAPYFFKDESGAYSGITTKILVECLQDSKRPVVFLNLPIERIQVSMQSGEIDINTYSYKKERESFVDYSQEELFRTEYRPFVRADSSIAIQNVRDFDRLKLGHILGLTYAREFMQYVEKRQAAGTLDSATTTEQNLRKLLAGRLDIFVSAVEPTLFVAQRLGVRSKIKTLNWIAHDGHYFATVSKKSPRISHRASFLADLNACLATMKKDGRFCAAFAALSLDCPELNARPG
jgi:polar amino acid transport system substrate-binding protein